MQYTVDELFGPADPVVATIHHWARLTSRWSTADPSLAKLFAKPGWFEATRLHPRQFIRLEQMRTAAVMARARLYFPDFTDAEVIYWQPCDLPATCSKPQKDLLCRLFLDFAWVDPEATDLIIGAAFHQAREWKCARRFERLLAEESKVEPAFLKFL